MLKQSRETPKVIQCSQHSTDDFSKLAFRILQWNEAQPLPPAKREGSPRSPKWLLAQEHEFLSLVIFNNEPLDVHTTSLPLLRGIVSTYCSMVFHFPDYAVGNPRISSPPTLCPTRRSGIIHPLHRSQSMAARFHRLKIGLRLPPLLREESSHSGKQIAIQRVLLEKCVGFRITILTRFSPVKK